MLGIVVRVVLCIVVNRVVWCIAVNEHIAVVWLWCVVGSVRVYELLSSVVVVYLCMIPTTHRCSHRPEIITKEK